MKTNRGIATIFIALTLGVVLPPWNTAMAHCDGMDGPVINAAQKALASGDVNLVLIWVREDDEEGIRQAFDRTLAVRELSAEGLHKATLTEVEDYNCLLFHSNSFNVSGIGKSSKKQKEGTFRHLPVSVEITVAPRVGLEPTTLRLTAACSTIELPRNVAVAANRFTAPCVPPTGRT